MIITFSNVPSRGPILLSTIRSALAKCSDPGSLSIRVLVDGLDTAHLAPEILSNARIQVLPCAPQDVPRIFRITFNHLRALTLVGGGSDPFGLVCEDDLQFARGWDKRCLDTARALNLPMTVLSLCSAHDLGFFEPPRCGAMQFKDPRRFYGHQAMLWSKDAAKLCADQLRAKMQIPWGSTEPTWVIDGATRTFCAENGVPVWATNPSLVKHVGYTSAWESVNMIVTQRFEE